MDDQVPGYAAGPLTDAERTADVQEIAKNLEGVWNQLLKVPANPDVIEVRPELADFMRKEIRRQVKLAAVRSPAGLKGLFPGPGKRKR